MLISDDYLVKNVNFVNPETVLIQYQDTPDFIPVSKKKSITLDNTVDVTTVLMYPLIIKFTYNVYLYLYRNLEKLM